MSFFLLGLQYGAWVDLVRSWAALNLLAACLWVFLCAAPWSDGLLWLS